MSDICSEIIMAHFHSKTMKSVKTVKPTFKCASQ